MKKILPLASACLALSGGFASAANIMLDLGGVSGVGTPPTAGHETLSPGHASGSVPGGHTAWNSLGDAATTSSLSFSDGSAAAGLTLTFGQETTADSNNIDFSVNIGNVALAGTGGGVAGRQNLLGASSIYGSNTGPISTVGRDGFFGAVNADFGVAAGAIGLRLDGLEAGEYRIYVMARNTNSNDAANGNGDFGAMAVYGFAGASAGTFDFTSLAALGTQLNPTYTTAAYAGEYDQFTDGENYVAFDMTIAEGESFFLASDGVGIEARGFLNMVQIVRIPEPSTALLGAFGFLALLRRRR